MPDFKDQLAELGIAAAMPVETCDYVGKCMSQPVSYMSYLPGYGEKTMKRTADYANKALADAWAKTCEIHEKNLPAIAHNTELRAKIVAVMETIGIPDAYYIPKRNSRSRYPKKEKMQAGYLGDLNRNLVISDGWATAELTYQRLKKDYDAYAAQAEGEADRKAKELARQEEIAKEQRRADLALASIIVRYNLNPDIDWDDVLTALREKDKYLDLAVAGLQTRGDWSEGFYRVESALGRFKIENDTDKEIAANICGCLSGYESDGRIFRDTTWSYDAIFGLVADKQLLADAQTALEHQK